MNTTDEIRAYFEAHGGHGDLAGLYAHLTKATVRQASRAVERMIDRGELEANKGGAYVLKDVRQPGHPSELPPKLWRAAHQLCVRQASFTPLDLRKLAGGGKRNVSEWLGTMVEGGHLTRVQRGVYQLGKDAPHRNRPPEFRWKRRGKAKTRKDKK